MLCGEILRQTSTNLTNNNTTVSKIIMNQSDKPTARRRHYYLSKAATDRLAKTDPMAACVAEAGGTLIRAPRLSAPFVGRGCGAPVYVIGTSGKAPCGCFVTDLAGRRTEHLCYYCEKDLAGFQH